MGTEIGEKSTKSYVLGSVCFSVQEQNLNHPESQIYSIVHIIHLSDLIDKYLFYPMMYCTLTNQHQEKKNKQKLNTLIQYIKAKKYKKKMAETLHKSFIIENFSVKATFS